MSVDFSKPVQQRNGLPVVIYETDFPGSDWPVRGRYQTKDGPWLIGAWTKDGCVMTWLTMTNTPDDLVNVPETFSFDRWVNVYRGGFDPVVTYASKESADKAATPSRIACIKVTFSGIVGEGLK